MRNPLEFSELDRNSATHNTHDRYLPTFADFINYEQI